MARQKRVLICCSNYWDSPIQVGDHHLARQFLRAGWKVGFISTPISPLHFLKQPISQDLKDRWSSYSSGGTYHYNKQLWSYVPGTLLAPQNKYLLRNKWLYQNWQKLTIPDVKKAVIEHGFDEVDLLYFRDPKQAFWLKELNHRASVYRIADHDSGFLAYNNEVNKLEQELASSVDTVCYTAHSLEKYVDILKPKQAFYLPNGVDFRHFFENNQGLPLEYKDLKRPIVVYVGSIEYWFDFNLMNFAAQSLPQVSFVFIGPELLANAKLVRLPNIYILGPKKFTELPAYLKHADAGMIPFNNVDYPELVNSINPLKMYEYMASGLPTLAPKWDELSDLNGLVDFYSNKEDFVEQITKLTTSKLNKSAYIDLARKKDWSMIFNLLMANIEVVKPGLFNG